MGRVTNLSFLPKPSSSLFFFTCPLRSREQETVMQSPSRHLHIHKLIKWLIQGMVQQIILANKKVRVQTKPVHGYLSEWKKLASKSVKRCQQEAEGHKRR